MVADDSQFQSLVNRIEQRQAVVAVLGLGYVGVPLVHVFMNAGFTVLGYDIDQRKIDQLNAGQSYIGHIPSEWVESWLKTERFSADVRTSSVSRPPTHLSSACRHPLSSSRDPDLTMSWRPFSRSPRSLDRVNSWSTLGTPPAMFSTAANELSKPDQVDKYFHGWQSLPRRASPPSGEGARPDRRFHDRFVIEPGGECIVPAMPPAAK